MKNVTFCFNLKFLVFFLVYTALSSCSEGKFSIGDNEGVINSWPGQNWVFLYIFLILITLITIVIRGNSTIKEFESLISNSKNLLPESIEKLKQAIKDTNSYSEENKKLNKEVIEKENKLSRLEGRIEELNRQLAFAQEKYKQDVELVRLQTINDSKKEKEILQEKIIRLESDLGRYQLQINLCSYYLAKYKINIYSDSGDDFAVQKRIWTDRLSQGDIDLVLDHMAKHSKVTEEHSSEITILQRRLNTLYKDRNLGMIGYNDENTKNEQNRIAFSVLEIIKKLPN